MKRWIMAFILVVAGTLVAYAAMREHMGGCIPFQKSDGNLYCNTNFTYDDSNSQLQIGGTNVTSSAAELNIMDGVGATAAEINMSSDISANYEVVTTTNVITAAECGKTFFLNAAAGFTSTLPTVATSGCKLRFVVKTAVTSNGYLITSAATDDIIIEVTELETDTGEDGPYDDDADTVTLVANVAIAGDFLSCISDGVKWHCHGMTAADGGVTAASE